MLPFAPHSFSEDDRAVARAAEAEPAGAKGHGHGKKKEDKPKGPSNELVFVAVGLYYGGELLHATDGAEMLRETTPLPRAHNPRWDEWLQYDFSVSRLPLATRLCFTVYNRKVGKNFDESKPLGWVNMNLFDDVNRLRTGQIGLRLWQTVDPNTGLKTAANPIGTCVDNLAAECPPVIYIELDEYHTTVLHPRNMAGSSPEEAGRSAFTAPGAWTQLDKHNLSRLIAEDPLYKLDAKDRQLVVKLRFQVRPPARPPARVALRCVRPHVKVPARAAATSGHHACNPLSDRTSRVCCIPDYTHPPTPPRAHHTHTVQVQAPGPGQVPAVGRLDRPGRGRGRPRPAGRLGRALADRGHGAARRPLPRQPVRRTVCLDPTSHPTTFGHSDCIPCMCMYASPHLKRLQTVCGCVVVCVCWATQRPVLRGAVPVRDDR
eukprot:SAG22_NODE_527_length_9437_cov_3.575712_9_plen_432_part_00